MASMIVSWFNIAKLQWDPLFIHLLVWQITEIKNNWCALVCVPTIVFLRGSRLASSSSAGSWRKFKCKLFFLKRSICYCLAVRWTPFTETFLKPGLFSYRWRYRFNINYHFLFLVSRWSRSRKWENGSNKRVKFG